MRAVAARDRLPEAYGWLAKTASWEQVVEFLALEGGPDGGFDDLVAVCQVGLSGTAKLELGKNYWDEMGQGDLAGVHTELHARPRRGHRHAGRPARADARGGARAGRARRAAGHQPLAAAGDDRRARPARAAGRTALPAGAAGVRPARRARPAPTPSTSSTPRSTRSTARTGWTRRSSRSRRSARSGGRGWSRAPGGARTINLAFFAALRRAPDRGALGGLTGCRCGLGCRP